MIYVIGLTQFVILSLGLVALTIIAKVSGTALTPLASFLTGSGLWLFVVPFCWILFANSITMFGSEQFAARIIRLSGILVAASIILCFAVALVHPTL